MQNSIYSDATSPTPRSTRSSATADGPRDALCQSKSCQCCTALGTSCTTTTLLYLFNGIFSRTAWVSQYQKGKTSLDLDEARDDGVLEWQCHQLDHMQTICTLLQTDEHANTSSLSFYRPGALSEAQPTVSKH